MNPTFLGIIGLVLMLVLVFSGLNIAVIFLMLGFFGFVILKGWPATWSLVATMPFTRIADFSWCVLPLFFMMGIILFETGIGEKIFLAMRYWLGHLPAGVAASVSAACALIGTMTGSGFATAALMSKVAYPEMRKYNYEPGLSLGVCASSATIAMMIPPSAIMVTYAILANASIGRCLLGGFIPGFVSMGIYMAMILIRGRANPNIGPPLPNVSLKVKLISLRYILPVLVMMGIIIGGIFFGVFTATEAAGMGALASFIIAISMKSLNWTRLKNILSETMRLTVMLMIMLMAATGFYTKFLTVTGVTTQFAGLALAMPSPWITVIMIFIITFILGMFLGGPLAYVTVPLFAPVFETLGFSIVWFILVMIKVTETGAITPPICISVFISQGIIKEVPMETAYKAVWWFVLCDTITLLIMILFPKIVTYLPDMMV